jgi:hypothetical protein
VCFLNFFLILLPLVLEDVGMEMKRSCPDKGGGDKNHVSLFSRMLCL